MRKLKEMIDKRTRAKIQRIREEEADATLSKKTSFSSFYNLEEQDMISVP